MELFNYDDSDIESIYKYAQKVVGVEFADILKAFQESAYKTYQDYINQTPSTTPDKKLVVRQRGGTGHILKNIILASPPTAQMNPTLTRWE